MAEYVNPKYAAIVRELRQAQQQARRDGQQPPVRGFITTPPAK